MSDALNNRYDFMIVFDVQDGNPNGDPDAGNLPRVDAETGFGLVTDVCLKRKVRNYVQLVKELADGFDIFIKEKAILNDEISRAFASEEVKAVDAKDDGRRTETARQWMCRNYYDIRTFGAVMSTGENAGQVRGPVQLTFARSVEPVVTLEHSITRMAVATEKEAVKQKGDNRTMGRKYTVPYGLYVAKGFVSPQLAKQTGFCGKDLELFWQALMNMFEYDRSAARGVMSTRKLIVFKHADPLGDAPAWKLFDLVKIEQAGSSELPPRSFADYRVEIDRGACPDRVEIIDSAINIRAIFA